MLKEIIGNSVGAEEFTIRIEPKEKGHTYNVYGWGDVKELIEDYPFEMQYNSQTGRLEVAGGQELYNENGKNLYSLWALSIFWKQHCNNKENRHILKKYITKI